MGFGTLAKFILLICLNELYTWFRARRLPPGITGLLCLFERPTEEPWSNLLNFNQKYGDLASMSLFGYDFILVASAKIASDLLDKRGSNYSDRPRSVMAGELSGWGKTMLLCNYTDRFRTQRKWMAQDIGSHAAVEKHHKMIEGETRRSLRLMLKDPGRVQEHWRKSFTSIGLRLSYGYITQEGSDPLVELAELAHTQFSRATQGGAHLVDFLPWMRYIPSCIPGARFKKRAKEYASVAQEQLEIPYQFVKSQLTAGTALPSLSSRLLSMPGITEELEDDIKWTASSMYRGSTDTTTSTSYAFYLAMTLYPRVMKKAQQELDSIVGSGRLPTFSDRLSLPYVEAVFTELFRWHTPGPLTFRRTVADDEYDGYLIPAGSYVVANMWAILRDERTYKDPLEFKPERFIGDDPEPRPWNMCFGIGRRRCPGLYLTHSMVWLMCAQSLAVFDISKYVENGVEVTPELNQVGGTTVQPAPFKCSIKPRSAAAERLVREDFSI
ncbi:cytochrome P450 [Chiua virens]|nr:cytochrome P450 [Chiua virens]